MPPCIAQAADTVAGLPAYRSLPNLSGTLSSVGDDAMGPLLDAWLAAFERRQPGIHRGPHWRHAGSATAFGALMFGDADIAPLAREPLQTELQPYAHQFAGDMMKSPLFVRVASLDGQAAYLAVNRRPGAPLPPKVKAFVAFALSDEGQAIVAAQKRFAPLTAAQAARERAKLDGFLPPLDAQLAVYRPVAGLHGEIDSVGSDGMKSLMDTWIDGFKHVQPAVRKGDRWEHLGTLNGFHALLAGDTAMAPMGRELWPDERAACTQIRHAAPLEIRVARGGFNTPQRTTAQAIFVHPDNPLNGVTLAQLASILRQNPGITRWGQLGLTGEWADRPITIDIPPHVAPNAMSMQVMVLAGGAWNSAVHEGSIDDTARAIAGNPGAIGFGGLEEGGPGLKTLAVARGDGEPFYALDAENAASGKYPLTRYMYIRLNRPLTPPVKAFLRYILSRDGQEPVRYSAYFPLNAAEAREELAKFR
ncbi:substrate-binding domain-containing protein [Paraburkholderia sp. MM5384-R2]|uniref:substrate-binding domain-containing protein n=1 Tax=Paraburkholderia sp. MM5384-R2 TaxID=2723097 RepID=UPI00160A26EF|nr:substrate-binding domain-containing protein [Paraburkholderia sp. MM5384-R2]MBB5502734.1 ABC-type phosphate transport system substrate-binding protein [Paraburkholderia sp. MM5384-R2]